MRPGVVLALALAGCGGRPAAGQSPWPRYLCLGGAAAAAVALAAEAPRGAALGVGWAAGAPCGYWAGQLAPRPADR